MSAKKDMRRADLVVPFVEPPKSKEEESDLTSSMTTMMPMVAMFTRNRMVGWSAVLMSLQSFLAETPEQKQKATTPAWLSVMMSLSSCLVTYLPLFLPPQPAGK